VHIDPAGWPFVLGAVGLALVALATVGPIPAILLGVLAAFFLFFFRDPDRQMAPGASGEHVVVSPADGRVFVAGPAIEESAPAGSWQQISIFLSPLDVHVNRVPVSGRVVRVSFTPGRFLPAYRREAGAINERSEICIDHGGQQVVVRQIVGILARRVVCRAKVNTDVRAGDRFGVMKFGSRMDVFLPPSATLRVSVGELARSGQTVLAVLHSSEARV
jgi:phosphatidylserine decarboxylase